MNKFNHAATDKKLGTQIDKHNDKLEPHQATAAANEPLPDIADDELLAMTTGELLTTAEGLLSERLKWKQDDVRLKRERVELLEACEVELKARADSSDADYDAVHDKTAKALTKAGLGISAQRADEHSPAAQRQFEASVRQSTDVQAALAEKKHCRGKLSAHIQQTEQARRDHADAVDALRDFITTSLKGSHHGHTQVPNAGRKTAHAKQRSAV